jgi:hypothetical protein
MKYLLFVLLTISVLPACELSNTEEKLENIPCDTINVTYSKVKPIFQAYCVRCHNDQVHPTGDYKLNSYANASELGNLLILAVTHDPSVTAMPLLQPKLDDCNIKKITNWVNNNMPE